MEKNNCQDPKDSILKARVKKLKASGAIVSLPDGNEAWLPGYEMYPDFKLHEDFRERGKDIAGQEVEVVEFKDPLASSDRLVSHIRVRDDPWSTVASWIDGATKVMEVMGIIGNRIIGKIFPGILAEIHLDHVKGLLPRSWQGFEIPLPGDEVLGWVHKKDIDHKNRVALLDFAGFARSRFSVRDLPLLSGREIGADTTAMKNGDKKKKTSYRVHIDLILRHTGKVFLADNDAGLTKSLCNYMVNKGCNVTACVTYEESISKVEAEADDFDLAIIDIHLKDSKDHLGLDVACQLQSQNSRCPIVLISGESVDLNHQKFLSSKDLKISGFVSKPIGIEELHYALSVARGAARPISEALPEYYTPRDDSATLPQQSVFDRLEDAVKSIREEIGAEAVVLFSMHPITYTVEIVAKSDLRGRYSIVKPGIDRSPIYDAAINGEEVFTNEATASSEFSKHRYLQNAYNYESCIGVKVTSPLGSPLSYALFAFEWRADRFIRSDLALVKLAAREIGYILRISALEQELRQSKPFEIMGKTYGSMAHELSSLLSDDFLYEQLLASLKPYMYITLNETICDMRERSRLARSILATFRDMARGQHVGITDVPLEKTIQDVILRFRESGIEPDIGVSFVASSSGPWVVRMRKSEFELILYNLLLNAAQQTKRVQCLRAGSGEILVELDRKVGDDGFPWGAVRIHDNGPGIHKRDFSRIFDIHYTTKKEGCGMGLNICRTVARSIESNNRRGDVYVLRSFLLAGSTFELVLPLQDGGLHS